MTDQDQRLSSAATIDIENDLAASVDPENPQPVATATPHPAPGTKAGNKRICGLSMTVFLLLCVILFLLTCGAILGGVFGSGVLSAPKSQSNNNPVTIIITEYETLVQSSTPPSITTKFTSLTLLPSSTLLSSPTMMTRATPSYTPYPLPTGTWDLSGALFNTGPDCISANSTTSEKVWACDATEDRHIVIHDLSSDTGLDYWLDLEGTNIKGVEGRPPQGDDLLNTLWEFVLPEITMMSPDVPDGCEVQVTLRIYLGGTKKSYIWLETIINEKACGLSIGLMSSTGLACQCSYADPDSIK